MKPFFVYEMEYSGGRIAGDMPELCPLSEPFFEQYRVLYNAAFFEMRKALDIQPYNVYADSAQFSDKKDSIYLLTDGDAVIGSAAVYGTEIDDLFVSPAYRCRGYGRLLLAWAVNRIRQQTDAPVTLHAAEWNEKAVRLYLKAGFRVKKRRKPRRHIL